MQLHQLVNFGNRSAGMAASGGTQAELLYSGMQNLCDQVRRILRLSALGTLIRMQKKQRLKRSLLDTDLDIHLSIVLHQYLLIGNRENAHIVHW